MSFQPTNSTVKALDNSTVEAWGNSTVEAWGNSTVKAWGNSTVKALGNSTVYAQSDYCVVVLFVFAVCFKLAKAKITQKSKTTTVIIPKYKKGVIGWLERHEIENKKIILYKKVSKDFLTQENSPNKTEWKIGDTVELEDWKPKNSECGEGKFHACARTYFCDEFRNEKGDKYIAIEIKKKDLYVWENPSYPHKIAFRKGVVLYEVDKFGKKLK